MILCVLEGNQTHFNASGVVVVVVGGTVFWFALVRVVFLRDFFVFERKSKHSFMFWRWWWWLCVGCFVEWFRFFRRISKHTLKYRHRGQDLLLDGRKRERERGTTSGYLMNPTTHVRNKGTVS